MVKLNSLLLIVVLALVTGCDRVKVNPGNTTTWQEQLEQSMALLGHRNWIVVTDMAYPLQARNGITTLFAEEPYMEVLSHVSDLIDSSPHLYAHVCLDRELSDLNESLCPGIENFRKEHQRVIPTANIIFTKHEDLIDKLDSTSNKYQVVVIKTRLALPYASTFFELDCKYWDGEKQKRLEEIIGE
jgi:D-ribose pyranose/furanose isomerase RbsD